ncbi:DEAD/DEAH box helicase [Nesterenkonia suensis]
MSFLDKILPRRRKSPSTHPDQDLPSAQTTWDEHGATITFPEPLWSALESGTAPMVESERHIILQMLEERGQARQEGQSFHLDVTTVGHLDDDVAELLSLPPRYAGEFDTRITGDTTTSRFEFTMEARRGRRSEPYRRTGAILSLGHGEHVQEYRLTAPLVDALRAVEDHHQIPPARRSEQVNVRLVARLHQARESAAEFTTVFAEDVRRTGHLDGDSDDTAGTRFPMNLHHFEKFTTHVPERVRVTVDQHDDGSLLLTPDLGSGHTPEELNSRWSQLRTTSTQDGGVLRVGNTLIPITGGQLQAIRTIHTNQHIPPDRSQEFLRAPGDYLRPQDDTLVPEVDLETFSIRVRAIGRLEPVTFKAASDAPQEWFSETEEVIQPEELVDLIQDMETLIEHEDTIERTWERGGSVIPYNEEHLIDVSDREKVTGVLEECRRRLTPPKVSAPAKPDDAVSVGFLIDDDTSSPGFDEARRAVAASTAGVDLNDLKYSPFPHQREGIEWLVSRMRASLARPFDDPDRVQGAILADDMGLGKTFMTLVALRQFIQDIRSAEGEPERPHLLVLPLTLLENWTDEMKKSFTSDPFDDVLTLHGPDLTRFRLQGRRRETEVSAAQLDDGMLNTSDVRLSLAVGDQFGEHRLDKPGRVVLTTYDTLASYQLSLGSVHWGAVIFDEAQDIKNPEALRTRAAKGLQARFKLVATGTPVENSLQDLWCLMDTAQPGALGTWLEFRQRWVQPLRGAGMEEKQRLGLRLAEATRPLILRRNKEDHLQDLPTKTIHAGAHAPGAEFTERLRIAMPDKQAQCYSQVLSGHRARASTKGAALKTLGKLRTISLHPDASETSWDAKDPQWTDGARMIALMQVLDEIRDHGEKAIVFVINKAVQRRLALWLGRRYGRQVRVINGDTKATSSPAGSGSRGELIREFEQVPGFHVIIMSPVAAGRGLTVTGANHAIHLERHWNPAKEAQATDRVYRIGQQKPVHVYLPMAIHPDPEIVSFDENLNHLMAEKTSLKDAVVVPEAVDERDVMSSMGIS